jgi:hypothetical protein
MDAPIDTVDLVPLAEEQIAISKSEPLDKALQILHLYERQTRIAKDDAANTLICVEIVSRCISESRWSDLGVNITVLAKRRGFSRNAIIKCVQLTIGVFDSLDSATRLSLVNVLYEVTAGKIFLEVERARLARILVADLESKGEFVAATNMLQDLRLEVMSSMDVNERISLMLLQFRLCLEAKDVLRAALSSDKIRDQHVDLDPALKLLYLELQIRYHADFTREFLPLAQSWFEVHALNGDGKALMTAILYGVLARRTPEQVQFLERLRGVKDISLLPEGKSVLGVFLGPDFVPWAEFEPKFASVVPPELLGQMRTRVIEHSLRVIASYYTRIRLARLAALEQISVDELEKRIIDLVFDEGFYAKIDRPRGIIAFKRRQKEAEVGDEFAANIMKLCRLVDQTHVLIQRDVQGIDRIAV